MSYMTRCRRFFARSEDTSAIEDLSDRPSAVHAPLLQSLRIECRETGYRMSCPRNIITGGAPALTSFRIEGLELHQCLPPLTNVRSLTLWRTSGMVWWMEFLGLVNGRLALTHLAIASCRCCCSFWHYSR